MRNLLRNPRRWLLIAFFGILFAIPFVLEAGCKHELVQADSVFDRLARRVFPIAYACSHGGGRSGDPIVTHTLSVLKSGSGTVTSNPAAINCGATCEWTFRENTWVTLTATPGSGYVFGFWSGDCTGSSGCSVLLDRDRSVTATFLPLYTLTVAKTGSGTVTSSPPGINCGATCSAQFVSGTSVTLTATPAAGYSFGSWLGDCTGGAGCSVILDQARSVTARFRPILSVTRIGPGSVSSSPAGILCEPSCSASFDLNSSVTLTATPDTGYVFQEWSGGCTGSGSCVLTMDGPKSVSARFGPRLTVTTVGLGTVTSTPAGITCPGNTTCGSPFQQDSTVSLAAAANANYVFRGWSGACTGTGACLVTMSGDQSVTANFDPILTVAVAGPGSVTSSPAGIDCGATCSAAFPLNSSVTLTAQANPGFEFMTWSGACSGSGACVVTMSDARSVTAQFGARLNVIISGAGTVTSDPAGIDCGTTCSAVFPYGATVTLTATPAPDWAFGGFSECASICQVIMDHYQEKTASFLPFFFLSREGVGTVTSNPVGIDCGTTCSAPFPLNSIVTLTATPGPGHRFGGWSGACTGSGDCVVTMTAPQRVTATFIPRFTLTVAIGGTGAGSLVSDVGGISCPGTCAATYDNGTLVTLTPTAPAGYDPTPIWGGDCAGTGATCTLTMDRDHSASVAFSPGLTLQNVTANGYIEIVPNQYFCRLLAPGCTVYRPPLSLVTLRATPDYGYGFASWGGDCAAFGTGDCQLTMDQPKTAIASYVELPRFTVTLSNPGNGRVTSTPAGLDCTVNCSALFPLGTQVTFHATPDFGYGFAGWGGACAAFGTGDCTLTITADTAIGVSFFLLPTHPLTVTIVGGGRVTSAPAGIDCPATACVFNFPEGSTINLMAEAQPGWGFVSWSGDCTGSGACSVLVNQPRNVTATFVRVFTLTVTKAGGGTGTVTDNRGGIDCGTRCSANYAEGTPLTLTATADPNMVFTGWSGACSGSSPTCDLTMDVDKTVTATFEPARSLRVFVAAGAGRVVSSPTGIDCTTDCSANFPLNSSVWLTAYPDIGYGFDHWGIVCSGSPNPCGVFMDDNIQVSAYFAPVPPNTLSVTIASGSGTVTSDPAGINCSAGTCSALFTNRSTVALTATPAAGYFFDQWNPISPCGGQGSVCTLTMNGDQNTAVTFAPMRTLTVTVTGRGTVTSNPAGINCGTGGTACSAQFAPQDVTLTTTPDVHAQFFRWTGACSGSTPQCTVSLASSQTVGAEFINMPKLSITTTGAGAVEVSPADVDGRTLCRGFCEFFYLLDTFVGMTALPDPGAVFVTWGGTCEGVGVPTCGRIMLADRQVTANFATASIEAEPPPSSQPPPGKLNERG